MRYISAILLAAIAVTGVVAQTNSIQLRNGANTTTLIAPSGGNYTLTLPAGAGSSGEVLTTDGSGTLSWGSAATGIDGLSDAKSGGAFFPGSLLLGHQSITPGMGLDDCENNTAVGLGGVIGTLQTGDNNTAMGYAALSSVTGGSGNTGIGFSALSGVTLGATNIGIGQQAGSGITTGSDNIAIGYGAFYFLTTGSNNVGVGRYTMNQGPTGSNNSAFGSNALLYADAGSNNVAVGFEAGYSVTDGNYNTLLGSTAGYYLTTGSSNVFIGNQVGSDASIDTESNLLMIDNSNTLTPLIYGDFTARALTFNGDVTIAAGKKFMVSNVAAPATSGDTGTAGEIRYDADYIYICTATNTWKRVAIATW